jgi:hypothetical protein
VTDFPNVPNVAGVPALAIDPNAAVQSIVLLTEDAAVSFGAPLDEQWGIFLNGAPVVQADCVVSFAYKQDWAIADYPVEQGGFESYDKVERPFDVRVKYSAGGDDANRQALLDSIAAIADDLNFYDVATPETTYSSANVQHYDYARTNNNGVGLLTVDVWLLEVRQTGTASTSGSVTNPQDASATSPVADGTVQSTPVTQQQTNNMTQWSDFDQNITGGANSPAAGGIGTYDNNQSYGNWPSSGGGD